MPPHRIHLKGPWTYTPLAVAESGATKSANGSAGELPPPGKARMPATWQTVFGDFRGRVRFERPFHRPTNLDADETVFLVFEGVGGEGQAHLNGQLLGPIRNDDTPQRFDITGVLTGDEILLIDLEFAAAPGESSSPGGLYGPVVLEIVRPG